MSNGPVRQWTGSMHKTDQGSPEQRTILAVTLSIVPYSPYAA